MKPVNHGGHRHLYDPIVLIHVAFGWQIIDDAHSIMSTSQYVPVQPGGHKHAKATTLFTQVPIKGTNRFYDQWKNWHSNWFLPLFWQGLLEHPFSGISQLPPVKPVKQIQR